MNAIPSGAGDLATEGAQAHHEDHDAHSKTGFWHTAWPYILGGAAVAAGGVALYFAARPGNDVNVTGARVVTN